MKKVAVMLLILLISGCATDPAAQQQKDEAEVAKRAQERWVLLIDGRLESAYEYLASGYKKVTPFSHYRKKVKGVGLWKSSQVQNVECQEDVCRVDVEIRMEIHHPLMRGAARTQSIVKEQWVRDQQNIWGFLPSI